MFLITKLLWTYNPQDRINTQVIYRFELAQRSVQVNVLLNNCKQNNTSLSLLVGTKVQWLLKSHWIGCNRNRS